jgi:hypothetical protein
MLSRLVLRALDDIDPKRRRRWVARLLIACLIGEALSHVLLVVLNQSTFFNHTLNAISWIAIDLTCVDALITSDVKLDTAESEK